MVDENDNVTVDIEEVAYGALWKEAEANKKKQIATQLTEIQEVYGDNRPYNEEQVIQEALFFRQRSLEALLEFGKRLIWIKENTEHGRFIQVLNERFDIEYRAAARIMQACVKLSNVSLTTHLIDSAKNKTKLFELMILDDSELDELSKGGTVAGIELTDIERMSASELRQALKKAKEETEAARRVASQKDEKINKLDEEVAKLEIKAKKQNAEAERLKLDSDPAIETMKSCQVTLASVSGDISASTNELSQIFTKAQNEFVPESFFKEMALVISQLRDDLDALLESLPEDIEPVDTSWMKQE